MSQYKLIPNQVPQVSAMNNGTFNIHLKYWFYPKSITDLLTNSVDECGIAEIEIAQPFEKLFDSAVEILLKYNISKVNCLVNGKFQEMSLAAFL